jgi:hypothetical protein
MNPVLSKIIYSRQLCSVDGKNILFGVSNIISYIASFDIFKAYDRVMLEYLGKVMKAMEFPDKFVAV